MKTGKKYLFAGLAALALMFLIAGNAHAGCKTSGTCTPGTSGTKWTCSSDGKRIYNAGLHGFSDRIWVCKQNGIWSTESESWSCYNGFTCHIHQNVLRAIKTGLTCSRIRGVWFCVRQTATP